MEKGRLEEQMQKVDLLLDIIEGQHLLSRNETAAAPSGPGPAGYELCPAWPVCLGPRCRSCDGSGYVKRRRGQFDPYLPRAAGPVRYEEHRDEPPAIKAGELTDENRTSVLERAWTKRAVEPPAQREHVPMTRVERKASDDERPRLRKSLAQLTALMRAAEVEIVQAALRREREGLAWFAKRLPLTLYVPGWEQ